MHEPEFYKLVTTVTNDGDSPNIYLIYFVQCYLPTSFDESKYKEIHQNALIFLGGYISKKEPSKISEKKTIRFYIVPGAPTFFYQQGNKNSYTI